MKKIHLLVISILLGGGLLMPAMVSASPDSGVFLTEIVKRNRNILVVKGYVTNVKDGEGYKLSLLASSERCNPGNAGEPIGDKKITIKTRNGEDASRFHFSFNIETPENLTLSDYKYVNTLNNYIDHNGTAFTMAESNCKLIERGDTRAHERGDTRPTQTKAGVEDD